MKNREINMKNREINMKNREIKETIYKNVYQNPSDGYVLTPSELAFEMISTLPNEVFKSHSTTFLDPICKSGTFLFEIAEKLYNEGHSIGNIEKRIYTIDSNSHSLNIANSYIKRILNKESGSFRVDFKSDFSESFFNYAVGVVSGGRFKTFSEFINTILIDKKYNYLMVELKRNISEFIERYEKVSKLESKLFGEVFTPRQLIDEMLDTLPAEVWKNKDLKWLDPAVGIGNFPAAILDRLMIGLEDSIPNEDERRKWILEEMLYMCDISIKNLFLLYKLFDENNEFKLNVYRGSFLEEDFDKHMKEVWGLEGFDVVVGNPPYQPSEDRNEKGNKQISYKQPLWPLFLQKSMLLMNDEGYLSMITPMSWLAGTYDIRKGRVKMLKEFTSRYNLLYCNTSSLIKNHFPGIGSSFSYYTVCKQNYTKKTKLETNYGSQILDMTQIDSLPLDPNPIKLSINKKTISSELKKFEFKSVQFKPIGKDTKEPTHTNQIKGYANGGQRGKVIYSYWSEKDNYHGMRKVLIGKRDRSFIPFVDDEGLNIGQNQLWYLPISDNHTLESCLSVFNHPLFRFLVQENKHGAGPETYLIYSLPELDLSKVWTEDEIFSKFSITKEEKDYIFSFIKK